MSDAIDNAIEILCINVAEQARDPEEARFLMGKVIGRLEEKSARINWESRLKSAAILPDPIDEIKEMKLKLAVLEARHGQRAIEQPIADEAKKPIQAMRERKRPSYLDDMLANLPPGTLPISEFAEKQGITYRALRHYIENGIAGDRIEITAIPFEVKGRPNYKIKLLTPEQQNTAIDLLKRRYPKQDFTNTSALSTKPTSTNSSYAGGRDRELPPGCILYTDFAEKIGIPISTLRDYVVRGIPRSGGIKIEAETRPKPSKPSDTQHYLTVRQQLTAIELLDRYRKLSMSPSEVSKLRELLLAKVDSQVEALP